MPDDHANEIPQATISLQELLQHAAYPTKEPFFKNRLRAHFGNEPASLPIVAESFAATERPNLHLALIRIDDWDTFVQRTEGASPALLRELLRRAALFAADEGEDLIVQDRHLEEALRDLVICGDNLTKSLLGMRPPQNT